MKKTVIFFNVFLVCALLNAQTFVSTEPMNRNVILEEFTGLRCGYCPQGHKVVQELVADNPERFFAINLHQGGLAIPNLSFPYDYRTEFGDPLAAQANVGGWPEGTVNRHLFTGEHTAMGRGHWEQFAGETMEQSSYVNVAARSTLDPVQRLLTVTVELYYTGNSPAETNRINVALLQNNIIGPQSGMNDNPDNVVGDQYRHMHMLRHLITGLWGDEIADVSEGSFVT
ncbi:MAG: Omp28-related outer membrane protein, partial [Cytophagaceae bacterium]|nr:Omp28-related outer membrane protein [Cytophagaceae bacterium]